MNRLFRKETIYSVYLRNHNAEGSFLSLISDLDRIRELGCYWVWLMPIHPVGQENKKGELGCPYSISDYRSVNPEYGSLEDFEKLVEEIHKRDMKLMIDVVYNHTSHGSVLWQEQPSWFYRKGDGNPGNKVGDWTDIIDLEYRGNRDLWDYQLENLKQWSERGVDGFRCDVAPLIPLDFWIEARRTVAEINPETLWLAETVHPHFLLELRNRGLICHSDTECFQAFDINYDYDGYEILQGYLEGRADLEEYLAWRRRQESIFPADYSKLRFLENHDTKRTAALFPQPDVMMNWLAFTFFDKGTALIYGGQENCDSHSPSLFDKDPVDWEGPDISPLIRRFNTLRQSELRLSNDFFILETEIKGVIAARYKSGEKELWGIFNVEQKQGEISLPLKDGEYTNQLNGHKIIVKEGKTPLSRQPLWFSV